MLASALLFAFTLLAPAATSAAPSAEPARHLIYLHGRIVQEQQSARPVHPEWGVYELDAIAAELRERGFTVEAEIRPKSATIAASADRVVERVRALLALGVAPDRITVVGASMGASIAFVASARLGNPQVRFATLGACLGANVRAFTAEEGKAPAGRWLAIREASDELSSDCPKWSGATDPAPALVAEEVEISTGLGHGFLYRPLPAWVDPLVAWAKRDS